MNAADPKLVRQLEKMSGWRVKQITDNKFEVQYNGETQRSYGDRDEALRAMDKLKAGLDENVSTGGYKVMDLQRLRNLAEAAVEPSEVPGEPAESEEMTDKCDAAVEKKTESEVEDAGEEFGDDLDDEVVFSANESISSLRALAAGWDESLIEAVGGKALMLDEGAIMQGIKVKTSKLAKSAKANMKNAKKAAKDGNKAEAKKLFKAAIADLKELQKEAEKIEDDHFAMVLLDAAIKSVIPSIAGYYAVSLLPIAAGSLAQLAADITVFTGSYICGMSKVMDYSAAVEKGLTTANKQGKGGTADPSVWWKIGETRGAVMAKFDRMITICEKNLEKLD